MRTITRAKVIGKSQNRTALGMMTAYLKMYPNTTITELRTRFSKQKVCPDAGIADIFYTPNEIEYEIKQAKLENKSDWFSKGNAVFLSEDEWLFLGNKEKVAFNKMWTASSLALLQKEMAKFGIYGEVGSIPKGTPAGFTVTYDYANTATKEEEETQGLPSWIWLVLVIILIVVGYFVYSMFLR